MVKTGKSNDFKRGHLNVAFYALYYLPDPVFRGESGEGNYDRDNGPFIQSYVLEIYARKILARDLPWMKIVYKMAFIQGSPWECIIV